MDFSDLLSFIQQAPLTSAQSAKAGLAGQQLGLQSNAQTIQNQQFNSQLALQQAQQLFDQQMGTNQFNLQKAQQDWAQNHAGQEFDLQKAQQEWQQGQGNQQFGLQQKLALAGNDRATNQQQSDLLDANMNRSLQAIQASKMIQDYFKQLQDAKAAPNTATQYNGGKIAIASPLTPPGSVSVAGYRTL